MVNHKDMNFLVVKNVASSDSEEMITASQSNEEHQLRDNSAGDGNFSIDSPCL